MAKNFNLQYKEGKTCLAANVVDIITRTHDLNGNAYGERWTWFVKVSPPVTSDDIVIGARQQDIINYREQY